MTESCLHTHIEDMKRSDLIYIAFAALFTSTFPPHPIVFNCKAMPYGMY